MNDATTPVRGDWPGVAAIDVDGSRYCIDCAKAVIDGRTIAVQYDSNDWETLSDPNGDTVVSDTINGDIHTFGTGGVVLRRTESTIVHCSSGADCVHAIDGDDHNYGHDVPIGGRLDVVELNQ